MGSENTWTKRHEAPGEWRKLNSEKFSKLYSAQDFESEEYWAITVFCLTVREISISAAYSKQSFILDNLSFIYTAHWKAAAFVIKIYMDLITISSSCIFLICKYSNFKYYIKFKTLGAQVEKIFG